MRDRHPALLGAEQRAVDPADAGDQTVGRRLLDQVLLGAPRPLAGNGEGAPFDEAAGIDQVVEILPRRALVGLAPPRHGVRPLVVQRERPALEIFGKIGPDMIEVDRLLDRRALHLDVGFLDEQQRMALVDRLAGLDRNPPHIAARRAPDLVLHLHGIHDQQRLTGSDGIALLDRKADDRALHRRGNRHRAFGRIGRRVGRRLLLRRLAEGQHGQRVDGIDPGAGLPGAGCRRSTCRLEVEAGLQPGRGVDQGLGLLVDEARVHLVGAEVLVGQQRPQEGDVAGRTFEAERRQCALAARHGMGEVRRRAVHDQLGEQ